jgi:parallel beta-helix repeat protein
VGATLASGDRRLTAARGRKDVSSEMTISAANPFAGTVINVKDHDAAGDGSTDDTKHLREAIAASREGDAIYFPPGTYIITKRLVPKARQLYFSLTDAATIKVRAAPGSKPFSVFEVRVGPVEFRHLSLDLSESQPPEKGKTAPPGILARAGAARTVELVVSSCHIRGGYGHGIRVAGSGDETRRDRVIVRDSLVEDCDESGLALGKVSGARVEDSRFQHCREGIQADSCRDVAIYAVTATENRRHGIEVIGSGKPGCDGVIVRDSLVEDCDESGLALGKVNGARVEDSCFQHCRNGIQAASCRDVAIYAVTATENRRHGIAFRYSYDWHVHNCMATANGGTETDQDKLRGWGIVAGGDDRVRHPPPNSDFTITDNVCEDNYDGGITLDPTVANDPKTDQDETALIWPQRARVSGNVCRGRKGGKSRGGEHPFGIHGIHVTHSSEVVVTDNHCYQNHNSGIQLVNSTHVLVQANASFENTNGIGIFSREDVKDAARHVIGVNMLYDNDEADLKGMR